MPERRDDHAAVCRLSITLIACFAFVYWLGDGLVSITGVPATTFSEAVYFSGITFATVGYGDVLPAPRMRLIAMMEGAIGMFTMSFFVVVLANRLRH
jgi:hypothetical protein